MSTKLFGNDIDPLATRVIYLVVGFALLFRVSIYLLNIYLDHPPYWGFLARTGLAIAWSNFGTVALPENFELQYKISSASAMQTWHLNDRGLTFLFVVLNKIFGQVTYTHVQVFHLILDALTVAPVMWLANRIAGSLGALVAGIAYALFLPQAQMAVSPDYNAWLGIIMIVLTWLALRLVEADKPSSFVYYLGLLIFVNFVGNEFRSVVALFAFGAAGWLWLVSVGGHWNFLLPVVRWKAIGGLIIVGLAVSLFASSTNYLVRNEFSPVRSSFGHAFFTGIGQYSNPIGMRDDDGAPVNWYIKETGKKDVNHTMDPTYNAWLNQRAKAFVSEYPILYISMVARRAVRIFFPNMAFTLITDLPSYTRLPEQLKLVKMRQSVVAKHGWLSIETLSQLAKHDPAYLFGLFWRVLLLILLPIGLISAIWLARSRSAAVFATLPLAYSIITLSFVYVTPPVVTGVHAGVLAVSASGLYLLVRQITYWIKIRRNNSNNVVLP